MICDPYLKILAVNTKYSGARHDSFIWSSSTVRRVMQRSFESGNHNMFLIGDTGYPLEPLMTPVPNHKEVLNSAVMRHCVKHETKSGDFLAFSKELGDSFLNEELSLTKLNSLI
ncbi:uncharacterized protein LOC111591603 [Ceratitis capitata]|uniref:uncharacterized protein LOC111591603 n=1 Tax=Ceratitis capitata TaxID=7213 RepID=UPI000C6C4364|nr:uncharacterized protein LOC111591603 [Ceratitis capitata]